MASPRFNSDQVEPYLLFRTSRSSGSGGQHVNKVETRVEAILHLPNCPLFTESELGRIESKLKKRMNSEGDLMVANSETRSQVKNRQRAIDRLVELINKALEVPPPRKPTKVPRSAHEARVKEKKARGEVKANRQWPKSDV